MTANGWGSKFTRVLLVGAACQALWAVSCSSGQPGGPSPSVSRTTPPPIVTPSGPAAKMSGSPAGLASGSPVAMVSGSPVVKVSGSPGVKASGAPAPDASAEPVNAATGPVARIKGLPKETQMRREKGYKLYQEKCASCHGADGEGTKDGTAIKGKFLEKSPAAVGAAVAKGKDPVHQTYGTADDGVDMASFLNYWK